MKYVIISTLLLLQSSQCLGEELPLEIAQWQPNVCRVRAPDNRGASLGTGVYLGNRLVLTAYHVVNDCTGGLTVTFHQQGTYTGTVVGGNSKFDAGYIRIDTPTEIDIKGVLLAKGGPELGVTTWQCGYGNTGQLLWHRGTVVCYAAPDRGGDACWFKVQPHARSGDSGGPVFNEYGELLGNLWGTLPEWNTTTALLPSTLEHTLGESYEQLIDYHVQCFGDQCYERPRILQGLFGGGRGGSTGGQRAPSGQKMTYPAPGGILGGENPKDQVEKGTPVQSPQKTPPQPTKPLDFLNILSPMGPAPIKPEPAQGIRDPIVTNPITPLITVEPNTTGFDWGSLVGLGIVAASSATGVGIPVWGIMAWRAYRAAKWMRNEHDREVLCKGGTQAPQPGDPYPHPEPPPIEVRKEYHTRTQPPDTYVIDTPPLPAVHRIDTQFIQVESDHYQRAHERARQEIVRKYPGAVAIIEAELSLTRQFAAGIPKDS